MKVSNQQSPVKVGAIVGAVGGVEAGIRKTLEILEDTGIEHKMNLEKFVEKQLKKPNELVSDVFQKRLDLEAKFGKALKQAGESVATKEDAIKQIAVNVFKTTKKVIKQKQVGALLGMTAAGAIVGALISSIAKKNENKKQV